MFQADATTRTTIPKNVTRFNSKSNLPIRTATTPTMPNTNGPYPRRCFAWYANAPYSTSHDNSLVGDSVVGQRLHALGERHSQTGSSELGKIRTTFARAAHQFVIDGDSRDGLHAELVSSFSSLRCRHIQHPDFARRAGGGSDRRDELFTAATAATEDFNLPRRSLRSGSGDSAPHCL